VQHSSSFAGDPTCPGPEYSWCGEVAHMEYIGLGALVALWRYFFDIDWVVKVKRRKRPKKRDVIR